MQEFEEIYTRYYLRVFRYVLTLCRSPDLAEEITQDAFFRAYQKIETFKGDCRMESWLCAIAKNCYFTHRKRERKHQEMQIMPSDSKNVEELLLQRETAGHIHQILHNLREPYREVFWLKTFGELGFRQIGELFGKSESWARVTYYRAKIMIREEME